jgi:hypothetical protein
MRGWAVKVKQEWRSSRQSIPTAQSGLPKGELEEPLIEGLNV